MSIQLHPGYWGTTNTLELIKTAAADKNKPPNYISALAPGVATYAVLGMGKGYFDKEIRTQLKKVLSTEKWTDKKVTGFKNKLSKYIRTRAPSTISRGLSGAIIAVPSILASVHAAKRLNQR